MEFNQKLIAGKETIRDKIKVDDYTYNDIFDALLKPNRLLPKFQILSLGEQVLLDDPK